MFGDPVRRIMSQDRYVCLQQAIRRRLPAPRFGHKPCVHKGWFYALCGQVLRRAHAGGDSCLEMLLSPLPVTQSQLTDQEKGLQWLVNDL